MKKIRENWSLVDKESSGTFLRYNAKESLAQTMNKKKEDPGLQEEPPGLTGGDTARI